MSIVRAKSSFTPVKLAYEPSDIEPMTAAESQEAAGWYAAGISDGTIVQVGQRRIAFPSHGIPGLNVKHTTRKPS